MKKNLWIWLMMMISLMLPAQAAFADAPLDWDPPAAVQADSDYSAQLRQALSALEANTPGAVLNYAVREKDDGRWEWDLFFTLGGQLGQAEIRESDYSVRKVRLYDRPEGGLNAADAMAALAKAKGAMEIVDLELERDDGSLRYEGEATLDGKRYEFEMKVNGSIIEWERD